MQALPSTTKQGLRPPRRRRCEDVAGVPNQECPEDVQEDGWGLDGQVAQKEKLES
jgi:hypothetical protein